MASRRTNIPREKYKPDEIIAKLWRVDVLVAPSANMQVKSQGQESGMREVAHVLDSLV